MNTSKSYEKSPIKQMFSSVFKREDIRVSGPTARKPSVGKADEKTVKVLNENNLGNEKLTRSATPGLYKYSEENSFTGYKSEIRKEEIKYEELLRKYERMQEFYKSQICALSDEVEHYKSLYHKVMKFKNIEQV